MAGLAHLGVGLAAKQVAPKVPVGVLIAGAYALDIAWAGFFAAGIEPSPGVAAPSPWSHGLLMSLVWSSVTAAATLLITRKRRACLIAGLLVFSHWIIDFIAKPMTFAYPNDTGVTLLLGRSPVVGLGVWGTAAGQWIGELSPVALGMAVYVWTVIKLRKDKTIPTQA